MTVPHIFGTLTGASPIDVPASQLDDNFNFINGNGAFSYLSTSPDYQFLFKASGSHYYDGNIALQNTTHTGGQVGNAAITLLNGIDGNQFSAFGGNMTDTGNPELALTYIGLGDLGGVSAPRFHYQFILNVNNGPNSLDFPNATYNAFIFDGQSGIFQFRDHLSQGVLTVDAEAHVTSFGGVQNFMQVYGGSAPGDPMTVGANGSDTDVSLNIVTKGAGNISLNASTGQVLLLTQGSIALGIANPASAVNYFIASGAATGQPPTIYPQGPDSTIANVLQDKGGAGVSFHSNSQTVATFFNGSSSAVNFFAISGSVTGQPVVVSSSGSDSNIDIELNPKGTGTIFFNGTNLWTANGAIGTTMTGVGPTGSHTTVQEWFTVKNAAGTVRYIPAY